MIALKKLIPLAPFSQDMQKKLIDALPTMSEGKQLELSALCWRLIGEQFETLVGIAHEKAMMEVALGKKKYNEKDFEKIENDIFVRLADAVQQLDEKGSLEEAREKLAHIKAAKKSHVAAN